MEKTCRSSEVWKCCPIGKLLDMIGKEKQFQKPLDAPYGSGQDARCFGFLSQAGDVSAALKRMFFQNEDPGKSRMKGKERFIVFIHHQPLRGWGPGRHDQDGDHDI